MPISSERYRNILERPDARGTLTATQIGEVLHRPEFHNAFELGADQTKNLEIASALNNLARQANEYGLDLADVEQALPEVIEQLQLEANAVARHEHDDNRRKTKFYNIPKQIGLRWQEMWETFGRGKIAERAKQYRSERAHEVGYMQEVTTAALERVSIRKRFEKYLELGGAELQSVVERFRAGTAEGGRLLSTKDFFDDAAVTHGIENIMHGLDIPDPFIVGYDPDTGVPIEMPLTAETERIIRNHLRFILRDELAHLVQMSQMQVMTTEQYHVESKKGSVMIGKVLGSGTFWGAVTRTGAKLAIGGSLVGAGFAAVPVGGAVLAAAGVGAVAGAASQVAQYYGARRKQRKMDLAIGAQAATVRVEGNRLVEVAKSAEAINQELKTSTTGVEADIAACRADPSPENTEKILKHIRSMYSTVVDAEFRLTQTKRGKEQQDYINFGLDNRLAAQTELLKNIRNSNQVLHEAMALFFNGHPAYGNMVAELTVIATETQKNIQQLEQNLGSALSRGEITRVLAGAVLGGGFAGLSSMAMGYIDQWFVGKSIDLKQTPTFKNDQPLEIVHGDQTLTLQPVQGDLMVTDARGNTLTVDLPNDIDPHTIVVDDNLRLYDAVTGKPLGTLNVEMATSAVADFKTPQLPVTLSPEHHQLITVGDKQFGLIVEQDGTITINPTHPDSSVDIGHPLKHTPMNAFSEDVHNHIASLNDAAAKTEFAQKAAQFNVTSTPEGVVSVNSVYDQSVVARFKLDAGGNVTTTAPETTGAEAAVAPIPVEPTPATPAQATTFVEQLFTKADSPVSKILQAMGVQPGEIKVNPDGTFTIANDAVKGEYLGQVDGWRQRRLELLLQAYQEKRIASGESAEVVLARLERATRHLVNERDKYPSAEAALKEAFGRKADFIQSKEVPYINGALKEKGFAGVRPDWQKLIDELRQPIPQEPTAPSVAPTGLKAWTPSTGSAVEANTPTMANDVVVRPLDLSGLRATVSDLNSVDFAKEIVGEDTGMEGYEEIVRTINGTLLVMMEIGSQQVLESYIRAVGGDTHLLGRRLPNQAERGTAVAPLTYAESPTEIVSARRRPLVEPDELPPLRPERVAPELEALESDPRWAELEQLFSERAEDWDENRLTNDIHEQEHALKEKIDEIGLHINDLGLDLDRSGASFDVMSQFHIQDEKLKRYQEHFQSEIVNRAEFIYGQELHKVEPLMGDINRFDALPRQEALTEIWRIGGVIDSGIKQLVVVYKNIDLLPRSRATDTFNQNVRATLDSLKAYDAKLFDKYEKISGQADAEPQTEVATAVVEVELNSEPVNAEDARQRLNASAEVQGRLEANMALADRLEEVDPDISARWMHQYQGHEDTLRVLADVFEQVGIFDAEHLRKFNNHLVTVDGTGGERLRNAHLLQPDNQPNEVEIKRVIGQFKANPDASPFS